MESKRGGVLSTRSVSALEAEDGKPSSSWTTPLVREKDNVPDPVHCEREIVAVALPPTLLICPREKVQLGGSSWEEAGTAVTKKSGFGIVELALMVPLLAHVACIVVVTSIFTTGFSGGVITRLGPTV